MKKLGLILSLVLVMFASVEVHAVGGPLWEDPSCANQCSHTCSAPEPYWIWRTCWEMCISTVCQ